MPQPLVVSWGWESRAPSGSRFQDFFGWTGTDDPAAYLSVPAAITFPRTRNWPAVRAACHALASEACQRIAALTGAKQIAPDSPLWWAQMVAAPLPLASQKALDDMKRRLWDDYQVEVPLHFWNGRSYIRISIQAYNTPRDVDRLLEGLERLLPRSGALPDKSRTDGR